MAPAGLGGRLVLVTGAARGIGAALTRALVAEGARVVAADIDLAAAQAFAKSVDASGASVIPLHVDVTSESSCQDLARRVEAEHGPLDALVNNAGVYPAKPFEQITYEEWRRVLAVNLDSVFLMTRAVVPAMKARGRGRIVSMSSGTVLTCVPNFTHYASAKAGIIGFTRSLAAELGPSGITVNVVAPGLTATDTVLAQMTPAMLKARREARALRRDLKPEDIVGAIVFLVSDAAELITGQLINVDGGLAMH
jgi:NAD(P)-dependent dehydrogenase (short-subunit alcohol dehydrogenase family)